MDHRRFHLRDEFIELSNLLKLEGICSSGGEAKMLVAAGKVSVDGAVELRRGAKLRAGQRVETGEVRIDVLPPDAKSG
ncbi:MAG TPA: RNA-binding S4 domain-containing protein [Planctomycetota bacterium]|nr:RNA-binding S4 domain-containing protein [Planctomycetota bacterium]